MTPTPIQELKSALRRRLREITGRNSPVDAADASRQARILLKGQRAWRDARAVLFYHPIPGEVDLLPLMAEALADGKVVALPRFDPAAGAYHAARVGDLESGIKAGSFGIMEPVATAPEVSLKQLDLILVPALAFDAGGRRLGRGRGFYDRLLAPASGAKCGVAYDFQIVSEIPVEPHDIAMNFVLTPTRWLVSGHVQS